MGCYSLRVMEAAAEAKHYADQQSACDELACVIHDVKSPCLNSALGQKPPDHRLIADNQTRETTKRFRSDTRGVGELGTAKQHRRCSTAPKMLTQKP